MLAGNIHIIQDRLRTNPSLEILCNPNSSIVKKIECLESNNISIIIETKEPITFCNFPNVTALYITPAQYNHSRDLITDLFSYDLVSSYCVKFPRKNIHIHPSNLDNELSRSINNDIRNNIISNISDDVMKNLFLLNQYFNLRLIFDDYIYYDVYVSKYTIKCIQNKLSMVNKNINEISWYFKSDNISELDHINHKFVYHADDSFCVDINSEFINNNISDWYIVYDYGDERELLYGFDMRKDRDYLLSKTTADRIRDIRTNYKLSVKNRLLEIIWTILEERRVELNLDYPYIRKCIIDKNNFEITKNILTHVTHCSAI